MELVEVTPENYLPPRVQSSGGIASAQVKKEKRKKQAKSVTISMLELTLHEMHRVCTPKQWAKIVEVHVAKALQGDHISTKILIDHLRFVVERCDKYAERGVPDDLLKNLADDFYTPALSPATPSIVDQTQDK